MPQASDEHKAQPTKEAQEAQEAQLIKKEQELLAQLPKEEQELVELFVRLIAAFSPDSKFMKLYRKNPEKALKQLPISEAELRHFFEGMATQFDQGDEGTSYSADSTKVAFPRPIIILTTTCSRPAWDRIRNPRTHPDINSNISQQADPQQTPPPDSPGQD